ncbi:MAG: CopG family transcriptional regulator [Thermomicrobiales bacterium]
MATRNQSRSDRMGIESTRTTLSIDNDVLLAVRQQADPTGESLGKTISNIVRASITEKVDSPRYRNGIKLFPKRPGTVPITMEHVNTLRDETI